MNNIQALVGLLFHPKKLKSLLSFGHKGYLHSIGWFAAFKNKQAIDGDGNPLPWVTYSFIDFIKGRIQKEHKVFEFGSGSSTAFYANIAGTVTSVEHDKDWYERIKDTNPPNATLIFSTLETDGAYSKMAISTQIKYDLIIVDGRDRVNCCKYSVEALTEAGVIVLDDSERATYQQAIDFLKERGFRQISFSGISPGLFYLKATSVFYRDNNCLGI